MLLIGFDFKCNIHWVHVAWGAMRDAAPIDLREVSHVTSEPLLSLLFLKLQYSLECTFKEWMIYHQLLTAWLENLPHYCFCLTLKAVLHLFLDLLPINFQAIRRLGVRSISLTIPIGEPRRFSVSMELWTAILRAFSAEHTHYSGDSWRFFLDFVQVLHLEYLLLVQFHQIRHLLFQHLGKRRLECLDKVIEASLGASLAKKVKLVHLFDHFEAMILQRTPPVQFQLRKRHRLVLPFHSFWL